jgi:hypothetical protein
MERIHGYKLNKMIGSFTHLKFIDKTTNITRGKMIRTIAGDLYIKLNTELINTICSFNNEDE